MNNQLLANINELSRALIHGDSHEVGAILDRFVENGGSIQSIYVELAVGAQCLIGEGWIKGEVTVAQEHRATQILTEHLTRIRHSTRSKKPLGLKAIVSTLPGDQHILGAKIVSDLLILDGWDVDFLGADTPIEEIVRHVELVKASLVGLSVSHADYLELAKQAVKQIRKCSSKPKIIIGGRGIMMKDNEGNIGADAMVENGADAANCARRVVGVVANGNALHQTLGEIGSRIHYYRKGQKMSQEKLAQSSGLDRAYISSVENGKQNVTIGALLKLTDALGIELSQLIVDESPKIN